MADDVKETIEHELISEEEKPDESRASRLEPRDTRDAAALHEPTSPQGADASSPHEPTPPNENGAIPHGGTEPPAEQEDPYARKGP